MKREIAYPLCVEFVAGTHVYKEADFVPRLPIVGNGPPGTFVVFADGSRVPLPTDQIVFASDEGAVARVGFGGLAFVGIEEGLLVFHRVRDLQPAETLSTQRGTRMTLAPAMVARITVDGEPAWPAPSGVS